MSRALAASLFKSVERSAPLLLLDRAIFYCLIVLIFVTAIPYGTVHPWSEALFECAVFLLSLLWVIHGLFAGSWQVGNMRVFYPMIALVGFAIAQSLTLWQTGWAGSKVHYAISADPFESWLFALRTSALILTGLLVVRFTSSPRRLSVLIHAIIGVAVASALFGIARQASQHAPGFFLPALRKAIGYAQFINKNHFAFLIEMAMGLVIGVAVMRNERRERLPLYLAALLLMLTALVLCNSRGGLFAMTVQLVCTVLLFVNSRRSARTGDVEDGARWTRWARSLAARIVMIGALLLVVGAGVVWLGGDSITTMVETTAVEMSSVDRAALHEGASRREIWRASWLMFKAHPLAGVGFGGYWAEVPAFHDASGVSTPQQAHNDYLELLASGGILGVALFVWFAIALIKQARASVLVSAGFQRAVSLGAIIGVVGVGVHSIVDFGLHITINALVLIALLAIVSINPLARAGRASGV